MFEAEMGEHLGYEKGQVSDANKYKKSHKTKKIKSNQKGSIEYETEEFSKLGSVVTNLEYSDRATKGTSTDINIMWYRLSR